MAEVDHELCCGATYHFATAISPCGLLSCDIDAIVNSRDRFEFDSMDFLNFRLGLEMRLGAKIPDSDYPRLPGLGGCIVYLCDRPRRPKWRARGPLGEGTTRLRKREQAART